ncbi:Hypothetical protein PHPALM_8206 [Phytophthora palmivora]|uniref:Uncharacterized protein n=1 Tax=Phytophthora palmivora TaxID=4796 RepID=A0A2P4YAG1_9STRA|nr:Hypothetical protein PHPALM_8206 [Phytophthora palmivora]
MVYSTGGELRTFVQVAAVGALAISSFRKCGISDGDKAFGIQVVTDFTCALGGLGCYNDHCRYCKLADTLKSAHFESCESLGASFPTMAPLTISSGPCQVSSGDAAVGVGAMTDPTCLYGGIGCFSDHCRFCQSAPTLQSSQFLPCSWTEGSSSTSGSDSSPVDYTTEGAPVSLLVNGASTSGRRKEAIEAGSASSCTMTVSDGDAAVGISITTDATCVSGGNGCIDSICRFCKVKDTPQSAHFNACPTADNSKVCTTTVSAGDAATGINIVTDATCAQGGLGNRNSIILFPRLCLSWKLTINYPGTSGHHSSSHHYHCTRHNCASPNIDTNVDYSETNM